MSDASVLISRAASVHAAVADRAFVPLEALLTCASALCDAVAAQPSLAARQPQRGAVLSALSALLERDYTQVLGRNGSAPVQPAFSRVQRAVTALLLAMHDDQALGSVPDQHVLRNLRLKVSVSLSFSSLLSLFLSFYLSFYLPFYFSFLSKVISASMATRSPTNLS
jgi:hypothetical protein